jgi:cell division inhibitor SulA
MASVIQLRQLLREKFPGLATRADELPVHRRATWASGVSRLDERLGGFPKSAISEVVAPRAGCGSALLLLQLLRRVSAQNQFAALIDGRDSFDAAAVEPSTLSRLLWLRCRNADEAVKAADLVLRDGNLHVVLLDLALNPAAELRRIPSPAWYRLQRIVGESSAAFIVFTPRPMIAPAETRVTLRSRFGLEAVESDQVKLTLQLDFDIAEPRPALEEELRKTA